MAKRGRGAALSAAALGVGVLGAAAFISRHAVREEWYIRRLRSEERLERIEAARELSAMGSVRAVPHLIEAIRGDEAEKLRRYVSHVRGPSPQRLEWPYHRRAATPLVHALWRIGDPAVLGIKSAFDSELSPGRMRLILSGLLERDGPPLDELKEP